MHENPLQMMTFFNCNNDSCLTGHHGFHTLTFLLWTESNAQATLKYTGTTAHCCHGHCITVSALPSSDSHITANSEDDSKKKKKSWASLHLHCQTLPTNPASAQLIGKIRDSFFHFICILIRIYLWSFIDLIHSFPTLEFWRSSSRRMVDSHHMMGRGG